MNTADLDRRRRNRWAFGVLVAGAALCVPIGILAGSSETRVSPMGSMREVVTAPSTAPSPARAAPNVQVRSGLLRDAVDVMDPAPRGIQIRSLGVQVPVIPVGVEKGTTQVPDDVGVVGWYRFGPVPGAPGSAVLLGHVDSARQGPGAFFNLGRLEPGDEVGVSYADGSRRRFVVVARRQYRKEQLPDAVFRRDGPPVLTLVTCGGAFDTTTSRYEDNVVVYAKAVPGQEGSPA